MNLYQKLVQREKGARKKINNGRFYARDVKVVDDSQLSVNGHLELVPAFLYSLYLTLYKTDTSVKWTPRVGPCLSLLPLFDSL